MYDTTNHSGLEQIQEKKSYQGSVNSNSKKIWSINGFEGVWAYWFQNVKAENPSQVSSFRKFSFIVYGWWGQKIYI